jgi:hypothetical protein
VSEGDVYRLWRRRPRAIGIVDGYFEHVPAVLHKEIMWIMEHGVHVFGSASVGALRAVELEMFGMNIRQTLLAAKNQKIISARTCNLLVAGAKALFYRERTWPGLLEAGKARGAAPAELAALSAWLPGGRVDQMADDVVAMLREMRGFLATDPPPKQVRWKTANTVIWNTARRQPPARQYERPGKVP